MSTILGRVRPVFRGEWDPETAYAALDMVRSADGQTSYTALKDVPAGTALSDTACWGKMVDMSSGAARPLQATAEGNPAQIWPDAGSALRPVTALAPLQSGSGDPSPDNVRPISGRTSAKLTRCGRNLLKFTSVKVETTAINGVTFTVNADGSVTANGTAAGNAILILSSDSSNPELRNALLGNQITMSGCPSGGAVSNYVLRLFQHAEANSRVDDTGSGVTTTFANAELDFNIAIIVWSGVTVSNLVFRPMIRLASETDAAFEPYRGDTFAADLGRTVYGGTLDWLTGVLTVTHEQIASYAGEALPGEWISDREVYAPGAAPTAGAQVVYALAEPCAIRLTPQQIAALPGLNTLFCDGDGLTVGYNKSIARMFEEVLALIPAASGE